MTRPGRIVVLNGAPRAGKTSIAEAMQQTVDGTWLNLGVDLMRGALPERLQPGNGLRPGGERPDLEPIVLPLYLAMYDAVIAYARHGFDVVVDAQHHDHYSQPLGVLPMVASLLEGLPAWFVGVRCPIDVILQRRHDTWGRDGGNPGPRDAVERWQTAVHDPGIYDLDVDTSVLSPEDCAHAIAERIDEGQGTAFAQIRP
jgi:chloramphenicol 3-O phosphotransferase